MRPTLLLLCLLVACTPAPTAAPTIAPTPTPDLESLLIQDGDLPAGFSSAQISDQAPQAFRDVAGYTRVIDQRVQRDGTVSGGITLFVFADTTARDAGYQIVLAALLDPQEIGDVGERAVSANDYLATVCGPYLLHVLFSDATESELTSYARRVLSRLAC